MNSLNTLYPDLNEAGGLVGALQMTLTEVGSNLQVCSSREFMNARRKVDLDGFTTYAYVKSGGRSSQVFLTETQRLFLVDFWDRGVLLGTAQPSSLRNAAQSINTWIVDQVLMSRLAETYSFVTPDSNATHHESGNEVEWRWTCYEKSIPIDYPELAAFFNIASKVPQLRELFPFTSLNRFCFSRCTGYPYPGDCPIVIPKFNSEAKGVQPVQYEVRHKGRVLAKGDAEIAVRAVVSALPKNCGPAVPGTADDLEDAEPNDMAIAKLRPQNT